MESAMTPEKWSHTFEDGDKAALPMAPGASGVPAQMKVFLKVELKKNYDEVNFKVHANQHKCETHSHFFAMMH